MSKHHRGGRFKHKAAAGQIMHDEWLGARPTQAYGDEKVSDDDAACALAQNHPKSYRPHTLGMAVDQSHPQPPQDQDPGGSRPGIGVGGAKPIGEFLP